MGRTGHRASPGDPGVDAARHPFATEGPAGRRSGRDDDGRLRCYAGGVDVVDDGDPFGPGR